jgi:hypothetical protein
VVILIIIENFFLENLFSALDSIGYGIRIHVQELKKQISYQKNTQNKSDWKGKRNNFIKNRIEKKFFFFKTPQKINLTKLDLLIIVFNYIF